MELTPQVLHDADFDRVMRGFDQDQVDEFLERVAVGVGKLQDRLREALDRAAEAERKLAEARSAAPPQSEPSSRSEADFDEALKRTLVLAQRTADAAIEEAKEEAATIVAAANEEVERLTADARDEAERIKTESREQALREEEARRIELLEEIGELDTTRAAMQTDIEVLTRHFDEQRQRVETAIAELRRLIDDPASLKPAATPEISDAMAPAAHRSGPPGSPADASGGPGAPGAVPGPGAPIGQGNPERIPLGGLVGDPTPGLPGGPGAPGGPGRGPGERSADEAGPNRPEAGEPADAEPPAAPGELRQRPTPIGLPDEARRTLQEAAEAENRSPHGPEARSEAEGEADGEKKPVEDPDFWKRDDDLTGPNPLLKMVPGEGELVEKFDRQRSAQKPPPQMPLDDDDDSSGGPPTAPVMRIAGKAPREAVDDTFLEELRKAARSEAEGGGERSAGEQADGDGPEQSRKRFGRRR